MVGLLGAIVAIWESLVCIRSSNLLTWGHHGKVSHKIHVEIGHSCENAWSATICIIISI